MADVFSVSAPLMIRSPHGGEKVIAELFPCDDGLIFFEIFWDQLPKGEGIYHIRGPIRGEGPWKAGDYVINLLGCQGTHPELAADFSQWQVYRETVAQYPDTETLQIWAKDFSI